MYNEGGIAGISELRTPGLAANSIPRVMVKLKDLSCAVSSLREKVDALRARLDIAMRQGSEPSPVDGRGLNKAPQEQPSPLADNLEHNIEALRGLGNGTRRETRRGMSEPVNTSPSIKLHPQALPKYTQAEMDAATERMAPSPCNVVGHVMLNWVGEQHVCGEDHECQQGAGCYPAHCLYCAEIESAYQRGVSDGIESVARGRTNNE